MRGRFLLIVTVLLGIGGLSWVLVNRHEANLSVSLMPIVRASPGPAVEPPPEGNLMVRELFRQAWLIAQRDGLGLPTRDALLREPPLPGDASVPDIEVVAKFKGECQIRTLPEGAARHWGMTVPADNMKEDYVVITATAERLSREEFVRGITSMGFAAAATHPAAGVLPDLREAESQLPEMNFFSQFAAVRVAHRAAREAGLSPGVLSALVRGYANLGLLSGCLWNASGQGFASRSILYAQRMLVTAPAGDKPARQQALWHRAYALGLAGMQSSAVEDLNEAAKLGEAAPPQWVAWLDAYCHFRTSQLADLTTAAEGSQAQVPAFLAFLSVEHTASASALNQFGRAVLQGEPDNLRVLDAVSSVSGVAANHQLTMFAIASMSKSLCDRVPKLPGVPAPVVTAAKRAEAAKYAPKAIAAVATALVDAGAADRGEPSCAVLGRMVQDANFRNVYRRISFEVRMWNVDPSQSRSSLYPLVADHPYGPTINLLCAQGAPREVQFGLVKDVQIMDPQLKMLEMLQDMQRAGSTPATGPIPDWRMAAMYHLDSTVTDAEHLYLQKDPGHKAHAIGMFKDCCPEHPAIIAYKIANDWPAEEPEAVKLADQAGGSPLISGALGQKYSELKQWPKAEQYLRKYLDVCRDKWAYERLADNALAQGNEDRWLSTLKEALAQPDYGLDHAQINVAVAQHFMGANQYDKAEPYALEAAGSWAQWAMQAAEECEEKLGHWDVAETWVRREQERYGPASLWHDWCTRTGHGHEPAAAKAGGRSASN